MQQVNNIKEIFKEYFEHNIPDRIIEMGTATGAFTMAIHELRSQINNKFDFITFDHTVYSGEVPENMIVCRCNILKTFDFIKNLIKKNTLILCDNGSKIREARNIIPVMRKGCVIMAHDFAEQDFWRWKEISIADIQDLIDEYKLQPHFQELMRKGAWLSLIK